MTMQSTAAPVAEWVDPEELYRDPYPTYRRLRAEMPVAFVPQLNRYFVTSFRDCFDIERDQETFSSHEPEQGSTMIRSMGRPMIRLNDPEHKRQRNAINPALKPVVVKRHWAEVFKAAADRYIQRLKDIGPGVDLVENFAIPYAADNLSAVIGFDDVPAEQMTDWSYTLIRGISNVTGDDAVWTQTDRVCAEIDVAIDRALARVRQAPDPSVISALLQAGLTDQELRRNVRLTISGGMNDPNHAISSGVWYLSGAPEQLESALSGRRTWRDVFEETIRIQAPVGMYPRMVTHDTVLGGVEIPEGSRLAVIVASANRDEDKFAHPDAFDLDRQGVTHMAFGNGTHICAGSWVAKSMVGDVALPELYAQLPGLMAVDPHEADFYGWVFRGAHAMPITWNA